MIIGTPNKVIDHIRRGNLHFSGLQTVVIDRSENTEHPGFIEDILFIFSKLPQKKQTILISSTLEKAGERLLSLLRRPIMLPMSSWRQLSAPARDRFIEVREDQGISSVVKLILAEPMESLLIQSGAPNEAIKISKQLRSQNLEAALLLDTLSPQQQNKVCQNFSVGKVPILVSTFETACKKNLRWVSHVINLAVPPRPESYKPRSFVLGQAITLGTAEDFNRLKENLKVEVERSELPSQDQVFRGMIQQILKKIKEEEDPQILNQYRSVIRKSVPFTLRSYFTAYLFKQTLAGSKKNRKVFPHDLIQLCTDRLKAQRSQIHDIKILDNYSFVEVDASLGEAAIKELSGIEFKGRKLAVNYARKRGSRNETAKSSGATK